MFFWRPTEWKGAPKLARNISRSAGSLAAGDVAPVLVAEMNSLLPRYAHTNPTVPAAVRNQETFCRVRAEATQIVIAHLFGPDQSWVVVDEDGHGYAIGIAGDNNPILVNNGTYEKQTSYGYLGPRALLYSQLAAPAVTHPGQTLFNIKVQPRDNTQMPKTTILTGLPETKMVEAFDPNARITEVAVPGQKGAEFIRRYTALKAKDKAAAHDLFQNPDTLGAFIEGRA